MSWRPFGAKPLPGTIQQFRDNWFKTQGYFIIKQNEKKTFYLVQFIWKQTRIQLLHRVYASHYLMMTSSNGNIFRVTGPLCGEFTGPGEFPTQRPVTRSFDVFFDLRLNKRLSKHSWGWWFETLSWSLWRHHNVNQWWLDVPWRFQNSSTILSANVHSQCVGLCHGI